MTSRRLRIAAAAVLPGLGLVAALPAHAAALEEIVVTAQKREQRQQEVPLSLEVVSGDKLDVLSAAGEDVLFLAGRVPSVYAESSSGRTFPRFYIRGLGNTDFDLNSSQPVSLVYDDIVLENPILKGFPVFDLDRIEVLRGPQGTLFGRNTPAGVIKFESARPTRQFEGYARASYGRFDAVDSEAAISGPIAGERLLGRLSLLYQRRDDFVENTFNFGGEDAFEEFDEFAGRLQGLLAATDRLSLLLNIHGRRLDGGSRTFRANIIEQGTGDLIEDFERRFTAQDATQILKVHNFGTSLTADYDFGAVRLTSVTGYETVGITARGDVDGGFGAAFAPPFGPGPIPFPAETADNITDHIQLTEELRLSTEAIERLTLQAGAFVFYEDLTIENLSFDTLAGGTENGFARQEQETWAWALFASASYQVGPRLTLNGGVRFSEEEKDFLVERIVSPIGAGPLGPIRRSPEDSVWSGDASLVYALAAGVDLYARVARSFRAPAIQGRLLFGDAVTLADTETIWSYEAGVKSTLWGGRARINATGFYFVTDDQQLTAVGGAGNFNQLVNADEVVGYGFELDVEAEPAERLRMTAGLSLNETEIRDADLQVAVCAAPCTVLDPVDPATGNALIDGNPLPQAPKWIANATLRYGVPILAGAGELFTFADVAYRSSINFFLYESVEFRDDELVELGVRVGYADADGRYEVAAFGRNILNDVSVEGAIDFNNLSGFVNEPPVWGVELLGRF